jgi:hypothetical protein
MLENNFSLFSIPIFYRPLMKFVALRIAALLLALSFNPLQASASVISLNYQTSHLVTGNLPGVESAPIDIGDSIVEHIVASPGVVFQTNGAFGLLLWNFVDISDGVNYSQSLSLYLNNAIVYSTDTTTGCGNCLAVNFMSQLDYTGQFDDILLTISGINGNFTPGTHIRADNMIMVTGVVSLEATPAVPEPGSAALIGIALLALMFVRRKQAM